VQAKLHASCHVGVCVGGLMDGAKDMHGEVPGLTAILSVLEMLL
jgi:hypothetical protein